MNKEYIVDLNDEERKQLRSIIRSGKHAARKICWAHALLKADAGYKDEEIAEALGISMGTPGWEPRVGPVYYVIIERDVTILYGYIAIDAKFSWIFQIARANFSGAHL